MSLTRAFALVALLAAPGIPGGAAIAAPVLMQLELVGVAGDSVDILHRGTIDVQSFSCGVQQMVTSGLGGGAGKASFNNLSLTKWVDKSSPTLFVNCASGMHLSKAILYVRPTNQPDQGHQSDMYKVILEDVVITSVSNGATVAGDRPSESLSLSYSKIQWFYQAFDERIRPVASPVVTGWDVTANKRY
jgi:type VI secretion system secreted protein Hcp